jgi:hypothetical protein
MATFFASRVGNTRQSAASGFAQSLLRGWGAIEFTASPAAADTAVLVKLPKGALVIGGKLKGDKLDSTGSGSALMSVNIGIDKAVVLPSGTTVTAASTSTALAANWSIGPDAAAVTGYKPEAGVRNVPLGGLLLSDGPLLTTDECNAYVTFTASALAFTTGTLILEVDYYMAQHA